jgi:hypothetical protein
MKNTISMFWDKVNKTNTCWEWEGSKIPKGYGRFCYQGKQWYTHILSYELHYGPYDKTKCICHTCDNPSCVNPSHLFLGTYSDNMQDCISKARHKHGKFPGELNKSVKLTEEQVLTIRATPGPNRLIAQQYGVSKYCIDEIKTRKTWKHL